MARTIKYIAVHCTASSQRATIRDLEREFAAKGWKNPGYHYVVMTDGRVVQMLTDDKVSNGVKGFNSACINVAYIGGIDAEGKSIDNRTPEQKTALATLVARLRQTYPTAVVRGHRDFSPDLNGDGKITRSEWIKDCPCFDAGAEYGEV